MDAEKTGAFIRDLRKENNITQQQLAELLCVSDKAVSRWETGRGFPDIGNLERIAEALHVSVAELLKGERLSAEITRTDMDEVTAAGVSLGRYIAKKKKWLNLAAGFAAGLALILLAVIHLTSPIYIKNADSALKIEMLSDGEVVAVLNDTVSGHELETVKDPDAPDSTYTFISCYRTLWSRLFGKKGRTVVALGNQTELDKVYYYPADDADQLIWPAESADNSSGGILTLPRLIYTYWIAAGVALSLVGAVLCIIFRKKRAGGILLKLTAVPVCLTVSTVAVLAGHFGEIYNAAYYLSGIVLLAGVLYALFLAVYYAVQTGRAARKN